MKKLFALILAALMLLSLAACGGDAQGDVQENQNDTQDQQEQVQDTTEAEDEQPESQAVTLEAVKNAPETDASEFDYTEENGEIIITDYYGEGGIVVIPETIDGKNVVKVENKAFQNHEAIVGLRLPDTMQTIGEHAFENCYALQVFVSGSGLKELGGYAFNCCKKLTEVELNDGLEVLGLICFASTNITEIEIPGSVTQITSPFTALNEGEYRTIIGVAGSAAEAYVTEYGEDFHILFQAK